MAYSYDQPLVEHHTVATFNFASPVAFGPFPCAASSDLGDEPYHLRQPRLLKNARVIGLSGIVATAGTGTIQIGDGTSVARYGTINLDATIIAANSMQATIELTEEGCHMGVADVNPATTAFTLTFTGTAVITNFKLIFGHW